MNFLSYHIASGQSFFTGITLIIIAVIAPISSKPIAKRISVWGLLLGAIAIVVSSTAIPYWCYAVAVCLTAAWVISSCLKKWRLWTSFAVILAWSAAAAIEASYLVMPTLDPAPSRAVTVIGDSITAGLCDNDKCRRWPEILSREHDLEVQDISHAGETTASALKRAKERGINSAVVVLEIGGNDLLGSTSSAQFARDLDSLLAYVCEPQRQVLMFELPLPPFRHEYGRVQRSLARKYKVALIPKRVLLSILATDGLTVDSIHLTQAGQQLMAANVWRLLRAAFPETTSNEVQ
jgi:acyl-CoA thioesterase I